MVEGTTAELQRHSFLEAPLLEIEKAAIVSLSHEGAGETPALHLVIKIVSIDTNRPFRYKRKNVSHSIIARRLASGVV